jgi:cytoskeletal protein CcmA (bactofilin family)
MAKDAVLQLGRKKHRRTLDKVGGISSVIGADSKFVGTFSGDENYLIYGTVEGDCDLDGTVVVEESALWKGKIQAANVIIAGEVNGDVIAKVKLELAPTAKIVGNVTGPVVAIAEGAVVEGSMHMSSQGEITHFSEKRSNKS